MLLHVVLFNFRDDILDLQKNEILDKARKMLPPIPGVMNLAAGKTIRAQDEYQYAISMYFEDEAALERYRAHPEHVRFRDELFFPFIGEKQSLDYFDQTL